VHHKYHSICLKLFVILIVLPSEAQAGALPLQAAAPYPPARYGSSTALAFTRPSASRLFRAVHFVVKASRAAKSRRREHARTTESVVLEEELCEDYEPTKAEILEYAKWLGMDIETEKHLFWIACNGLKAPLPKAWKPCKTPDGEIYYFNFETGESVWDHPCDEYYRKVHRPLRPFPQYTPMTCPVSCTRRKGGRSSAGRRTRWQ
jgi:hypothetical protein